MSFRDIIGQESAVHILQDQLKSGRINHAYLFLGREGVGKETLAYQFARAINCQEKEFDSCEECLACRKINHGNHPDVSFLTIEEGQTIKIEQIRGLQHELAFKPYESTRKIYIIDRAERMTPEAANSLLKTLEEPPEYVIIILLAEEISKLLPTIISRCQQIHLSTLSRQAIQKKLTEIGMEREKADLIARLADGSLGRAIRLAHDDEFLQVRASILKLLSELSRINTVELFKQSDLLIELINNNFPVFNLILSWYRDIIIYNQGSKEQLINYDYLTGIDLQQEIYSIEELTAIITLINQTKNDIDLNVRKDLALQVMLLRIRAKRFD
jgi:DNA polymerase III subunit delta'